MRKLFVVLALLATFASWGQKDAQDLIGRSTGVQHLALNNGKTPIDSLAFKYVAVKQNGLKDVKISFTPEQLQSIEKLWLSEWPEFDAAVTRYKDGFSMASEVDLIKILVKNEQAFRDLLTKEQYAQYVIYGKKHGLYFSEAFYRGFMSDKVFNKYKDKLK